MIRTLQFVPIALLASALAACSSSGDATPGPTSAADLGRLIGCHGYAVSHDDSLGIGKSMGLVTDASCTMPQGGQVQVQWYKSHDGAEQAVKLGQQMGGSGSCLVGDNWLVCGSGAAINTAQQKVGGNIQQMR